MTISDFFYEKLVIIKEILICYPNFKFQSVQMFH